MAPLLLVFLAVADADREPARAMLATAAQAFGTDVTIAVERFDGPPPTLAALASAARERGATGAARVLWREAGGSQVSVDVYLAGNDLMSYRVLNFGPQDQASERGRAIGLVLAALVLAPEESRLRPAAAPSPPETIPVRPKVAAVAPIGSPSVEAPVVAVSGGAIPGRSGAAANGTIPPSAPGRWALDALVAGGTGLGGSGGGIGGGIATRRLLGERWGARLGLHARTGSIPAAQASSLAAGLAGGLFCSLRSAGAAAPPWNVGARLDFILGYDMLTHFSDDDPMPVRRGRFLPLAAAWVEADWAIGPAAMLHAGAGMEVAAGTTRVVVRGADAGRLSPFRAVAELGLRLRF